MDIEKELQLMFFNIISELFEQATWDEDFLEKILWEVSKYMGVDYLALYVHFKKSESLRLLASVSADEKYLPELLVTGEDIHFDSFFKDRIRPKNVRYLPLQIKGMRTMLLVYIHDTEFSEQFLLTLQRETERILNISISTWRNKIRNLHNQFLHELSENLLQAHDKRDVFEVIFDSLDHYYWDAKYHLYLTQEYDKSCRFPIKVLDYTEKNPVPLSTQVFMSGKMQIEVFKERNEKVLYAPLIGEQSVYGVLEVIVPIESYLLREEVDFFLEFARLSGKALEKTILYEDSLEQVSNLTLLNEFIHELNATREMAGLMDTIREQIKRISNASEIGFIYFDEESDREFEILDGSTEFFLETDGRNVAVQYKEKIMKTPDSIFNGNATDLEPYGYQSAMIIPMVYSGLSIGFTIILHEKPYYFSLQTFRMLESLMHHSALVISNTLLRERLQETVITDFLTGLYTRRYLEETIDEHQENGSKAVLLLFDIDDFKLVNDTYGHHVGDNVLKQVARVMKEVIGNKGVITRWGGEELAVYLPEASPDEGMEIANNIRKRIPEGTDPSITVSCGLSHWEKEAEDTPKKMFLRADQALYSAKSAGKDQVQNEQLLS